MPAQQILEPEPIHEVADGVPEDGEPAERPERRILVGRGEPDAEARAKSSAPKSSRPVRCRAAARTTSSRSVTGMRSAAATAAAASR
jgi:hypothetical protein